MVPTVPWRRSRTRVPAQVGAGFVAAEAPALQATIRSAFVGAERVVPGAGGRSVPAELSFEPGAAGRVVVVWRNRNVGFVPEPQAAALRRQLDEPGPPQLVAEGQVYHDGTWWRVWVGPPPGELPVPDEHYDELVPEAPTIFGFAIGQVVRPSAGPEHR
jgi:hypothetical protein